MTTLPVTLGAFVRPQAEFLLSQGWDVTFVCSDSPSFREALPPGIQFFPLPFRRGMDVLGVPRAILALYRLFRRESFPLVQYSTPNAAFYASTAAWLARVPVRLYAQWGIRYVGFQGFRRWAFKRLEAWCCRRSTLIQPDSAGNLAFSIQEGLYPREKGRVIWNGSACGVDLKRFDAARRSEWRADYRNRIGLEDHHQVIGFVGSVRRDKGCQELLSACQELFTTHPDARLLLVGDKQFYTDIAPQVRAWADHSPQVLHIPPTADIPQWMACMDVLTLPSYREGFGTVIIEAEAMGIPVVVSDVPGPVDAMMDGETGFTVPVQQVAPLAAALRTLLSDAALRRRLGEQATAFARDRFEQAAFFARVLVDKEGLL